MAEGNNPNSPVYAEKKLKRPESEIRAELLKDPDVAKQASILKISVQDYVEKIIDYAKHPEKPPQLTLTSDEELKKVDPKYPTQEEVAEYMTKLQNGEIAVSPAHRRDGFQQAESSAPTNFEKALGSADSLKGKTVEANKDLEIKKGQTFKP